MMTRKHYQMIADAISRVASSETRATCPFVLTQLISELSVVFSQDNPRFQPARFEKACLKPQENNQ
jgi:hypothetical protein